MKASRGCGARSFITSWCEEMHCAFRPVRVLWKRSLDLKREHAPSPVTGVGLKPFRALQKAGKGLEFNNLARGFASFCQFESSKVE